MILALAVFLAYLLGSVSPSYLLGKYLRGIDLRKHGSGNVGATNAMRVLGKGPGLAVLLVDLFKGWAAVALIPKWLTIPHDLFQDPLVYPVLIGLAVVAGHNWTLFLRFRGGKGVATGFGVLLALAPKVGLSTFGIWLIVVLLRRNVGVASMISAALFPILMLLFKKPPTLLLLGLILSISTLFRHRKNIQEIFLTKK